MLTIRNIEWIGAGSDDRRQAGPAAGPPLGHLRLLDQTLLPARVTYLDCTTVEQVWDAIKRLAVRGAPAIGIAAAYGCVVGVQQFAGPSAGEGEVRAALARAAEHLATSRPTAVNLFWALERMRRVRPCAPARLLEEARAIHAQDAAMCRRIGELALPLLTQACAAARERRRPGPAAAPAAILTHCNAGALATGGLGTATAAMYLARERGLPLRVVADETRPLLQGSRLTAFELAAAGIDVTVICDNMAGALMAQGEIAAVITGADRIAANGDAANKIGTYSLAVLARHHGLPFYVAAPSSTFDLSIPDGSHIPIEQRAGSEILAAPTDPALGRPSPRVHNPAFDVTPHPLITAIITERGLVQPVDAAGVSRVLGSAAAGSP